MNRHPVCRFAVAPHFQLAADWSRRLLIGSDDCWRVPTPEELLSLTQTNEPHTCVTLFQLPGHLGSAWWKLLDQSADTLGNGRLPGFDSFVSQVIAFLAFKSLPVPKDARFDVVVSTVSRKAESRVWGEINLGDEATSLVLSNPGSESMRVILGPGEGYLVPQGDLNLHNYLEGKQEPDVRLVISHPLQTAS